MFTLFDFFRELGRVSKSELEQNSFTHVGSFILAQLKIDWKLDPEDVSR